jgi:hypothetical protein
MPGGRQMNTPTVYVRIPESLQAAARRATGRTDLSVAIRAGLQLLIECPPEKMRELLIAQLRRRGRPREFR